MHFIVEKEKKKIASVLQELETDGRVTLAELKTAESLIFILWVFLKKRSAEDALRRQGYGACVDLTTFCQRGLFALCKGHSCLVKYKI